MADSLTFTTQLRCPLCDRMVTSSASTGGMADHIQVEEIWSHPLPMTARCSALFAALLAERRDIMAETTRRVAAELHRLGSRMSTRLATDEGDPDGTDR